MLIHQKNCWQACWRFAAQSAVAQPVLEEIVVTATKRAVNEMDTPLSMEAMTGDRIEETGIRDLADISTIIPNVHINEGYNCWQCQCSRHGFGELIEDFEQSVALFVDDVLSTAIASIPGFIF